MQRVSDYRNVYYEIAGSTLNKYKGVQLLRMKIKWETNGIWSSDCSYTFTVVVVVVVVLGKKGLLENFEMEKLWGRKKEIYLKTDGFILQI